ncbi:30S ribosome-binding factor RbfA [Patescibacteria group bacterium AH-259-L05]|nr:30S ribosome-binding factor RbfA [Patescibacteria group bacterium AH-259-L05]
MSQRIQKVNELIKRELGAILMHEIEVPENSLITIAYVKTSKDLMETKVFMSIFPIEYAPKVLAQIKKRIGYLQKLLNRRLVMRRVPKIIFLLDTTEEEASQVEDMLKQV